MSLEKTITPKTLWDPPKPLHGKTCVSVCGEAVSQHPRTTHVSGSSQMSPIPSCTALNASNCRLVQYFHCCSKHDTPNVVALPLCLVLQFQKCKCRIHVHPYEGWQLWLCCLKKEHENCRTGTGQSSQCGVVDKWSGLRLTVYLLPNMGCLVLFQLSSFHVLFQFQQKHPMKTGYISCLTLQPPPPPATLLLSSLDRPRIQIPTWLGFQPAIFSQPKAPSQGL